VFSIRWISRLIRRADVVRLNGSCACEMGWTAGPVQDERLTILRANLHTAGSGDEARRLYPDLIQVYLDDGGGKPHPVTVLPFRYYWSPSARTTPHGSSTRCARSRAITASTRLGA
jgi:hypothetical protein